MVFLKNWGVLIGYLCRKKIKIFVMIFSLYLFVMSIGYV